LGKALTLKGGCGRMLRCNRVAQELQPEHAGCCFTSRERTRDEFELCSWFA
jgi:hypothetical protein